MPHLKKIWLTSILSFFLAGPAQALDLDGSFKQGGMVIGQTEPGGKIFLDEKEVLVGPAGRFVIGFGRDENENVVLKFISPNGITEELTLTIEPQTYEIERVDGLPERTVTIPEEEKIRRKKEQGMVAEARSPVSSFLDWAGGFFETGRGEDYWGLWLPENFERPTKMAPLRP